MLQCMSLSQQPSDFQVEKYTALTIFSESHLISAKSTRAAPWVLVHYLHTEIKIFITSIQLIPDWTCDIQALKYKFVAAACLPFHCRSLTF